MTSKPCQLVDADENGLYLATERLKEGRLVAFPTETVYGLGAYALDRDAVLKVFKAKNRPTTSPLIVHVLDLESASNLVTYENESIRLLVKLLSDKFWPGPLTIILKASDVVPPEITAFTGYVGIRVPRSDIARRLLSVSGIPIA